MTGANWSRNEGWLSDAPPGEWFRVTADDDCRVTKLRLPLNQLRGQPPSDLGGLPYLTHLDLSGNQLTGEIPLGLGDLPNLTELRLGQNKLSGEIPPQLGNLANLTGLQIHGNQLSGCVPRSLQDQLSTYYSGIGLLPFCIK